MNGGFYLKLDENAECDRINSFILSRSAFSLYSITSHVIEAHGVGILSKTISKSLCKSVWDCGKFQEIEYPNADGLGGRAKKAHRSPTRPNTKAIVKAMVYAEVMS